jgi:DNA-binding transcriptional LysR family regulator
MPVSTASRKVSNLEKQLGIRLLQRTTRKLNLSTQGREFYEQCRQPLHHLYDAEHSLSKQQSSLQGLLRITVPVIMGHGAFTEFISAFVKLYPNIRINLVITNLDLDLIAENIDIAISIGEDNSSFATQKIGTTVRYLVAAPSYLQDHSLPAKPADLTKHNCLLLHGGRNNEVEWHLINGKKSTKVRVSGSIASNDFQSVSTFTYQGHGIGLLPSTYCNEQIKKGELIRILPNWSSISFPVYVLYHSKKFMPAKTRVFLQLLKNWGNPPWTPD